MGDEAASLLRSGVLIKRGERVQNWKKRYMELRGRTLFYFAKQEDAEKPGSHRGSVVLAGADVREVQETRFKRQFVFEISHPARRSFFLQAATPSDRDGWINDLCAAAGTQYAGAPAAGGGGGGGGFGPGGAGGTAAAPAEQLAQQRLYARSTAEAEELNLPSLADAKPEARTELLRRKLALCSQRHTFEGGPSSADAEVQQRGDKRAREAKREALLDVLTFCDRTGSVFKTEPHLFGEVLAMVGANLFRALPPRDDLAAEEDDEDEPFMEAAWPHLSIAYELLLHLVQTDKVELAAKKKFFDLRFVDQLVLLFDSQDMREREYLKTIVHRIYGKLTQRRAAIRRMFAWFFQRFVFETEQQSGMCEALDILGSIVNGFATPIKPEHKKLLERSLIPLHKPKSLAMYHPQLIYLMVQYAAKDPSLTTPIVRGLIKFWPYGNSAKETMFLDELEEIFDFVEPEQLEEFFEPLLHRLRDCCANVHFQVAERALSLWHSPHIHRLLVEDAGFRPRVLDILYPALRGLAGEHWNGTVHEASEAVLQLYGEVDLELLMSVQKEYDASHPAQPPPAPPQ